MTRIEFVQALNKFESAVIDYWCEDSKEFCSFRKLRKLHDKMEETKKELIDLVQKVLDD